MQFEVGCGALDADMTHRCTFVYFAPSAGIIFGSRHVGYLLAGATTWPTVLEQDGVAYVKKGVWYPKVDAGVDFRLNDMFYLNVGTTYFLLKKPDRWDWRNFMFSVGIGFNI